MIRPDDLVVSRWRARFMGRQLPCAIGRGGVLADKREGDGATPAGTHRIMGMFYRPDRLARHQVPGWARPIRPGDLWADDPAMPDYNQLVRAPCRHSHEQMRRADPLYDIVLVTDWNCPLAEAGRGSAIFLHLWRKPRHPTAGCVAFRRDHMLWLLARIAPGTRVVVRG